MKSKFFKWFGSVVVACIFILVVIFLIGNHISFQNDWKKPPQKGCYAVCFRVSGINSHLFSNIFSISVPGEPPGGSEPSGSTSFHPLLNKGWQRSIRKIKDSDDAFFVKQLNRYKVIISDFQSHIKEPKTFEVIIVTDSGKIYE